MQANRVTYQKVPSELLETPKEITELQDNQQPSLVYSNKKGSTTIESIAQKKYLGE